LFACASLGYPGEVTVAKAAFRGLVVGTVLFTQLSSDPYSDVSVFMDLSYGQLSAPSTMNHNWHVHNYPISTETDSDKGGCLSTGGHWNPYNIDTTGSVYTVNCAPDSPFACEVGDISGKHKTVDLQSEMGTVATKNFYTDTTSWLSGMIGRSLVIHGPNQTGPRIACFGDLTGQNNFQNQDMDGNMPLSGPNSIIGRSLVIHYANGSRLVPLRIIHPQTF
uniref:Superoxide dismutase copper/zinc binding domain-containing protein n=1 Tax=Sinocyclocheilus rhinocerous TaxID=307959 RepID=A0A673GAC8_9TELE